MIVSFEGASPSLLSGSIVEFSASDDCRVGPGEDARAEEAASSSLSSRTEVDIYLYLNKNLTHHSRRAFASLEQHSARSSWPF